MAAKFNQAIISATYICDIEVIKILLADPRVNPGDQNNQAIINAAKRGKVEIVKLLLDSVFQSLLAACEKGDLKDIMKRLDYFSSDDLLS